MYLLNIIKVLMYINTLICIQVLNKDFVSIISSF